MMDRRLLHRLRSDERGTTLVEVIAAAIILVVIAGAVTSLVSAAQRESGQSRVIAIAGDLAQSELEQLRAKKFSQLVAMNETAAVAAGGLSFTVKRTSSWASEGAGAGAVACSSAANTPEALRVSVSVEWDSMTRRPVQLDSLVAAPVSEETKGNFVVQVNDRNGEGVGDVPVSMSGPTPNDGNTDATGCLRFTALEQGAYTVTLNKPGYVDRDHTPAPTAAVVVSGGETGSKAFDYDRGGGIKVGFVRQAAKATPAVTTPTTVQGAMFKNAGVPSVTGVLSASGAVSNAVATHPKLLWPHSAQYEVHADKCDTATAVGGATVAPGDVPATATDIKLPQFSFKVTGIPTQAVADTMRVRFTTPCGTVLPEATGTWDAPTKTWYGQVASPPGLIPFACVYGKPGSSWSWGRWVNGLTLGAADWWRELDVVATPPAGGMKTGNSGAVCTS